MFPLYTDKIERKSVSFTARFKIQDISDGPSPIDILAVAEVEDGSLTQNTEKAVSMELKIVLDANKTKFVIGDVITVNGHFYA
jgi:hypothetical protein